MTLFKKYLSCLSLNKHLHCSVYFQTQQHSVCIAQFAGFLSTVILPTCTAYHHMRDESLPLETLHCGARKMESQRNCKISIQFVRSFPNTHSFSTIFAQPPPPVPTFPAFARRYVCVCNSTRRCQLSKNSTMSTCLLMLKIRSPSLPSFWFLYFTLYRTNKCTHFHIYILCCIVERLLLAKPRIITIECFDNFTFTPNVTVFFFILKHI